MSVVTIDQNHVMPWDTSPSKRISVSLRLGFFFDGELSDDEKSHGEKS